MQEEELLEVCDHALDVLHVAFLLFQLDDQDVAQLVDHFRVQLLVD